MNKKLKPVKIKTLQKSSLTSITACIFSLDQEEKVIFITYLTGTFLVSEHLLAGLINWSTLESMRIESLSSRFSRPSSESKNWPLKEKQKSKVKKNISMNYVLYFLHETILSEICSFKILKFIFKRRFTKMKSFVWYLV